jgi:hypothetical protein
VVEMIDEENVNQAIFEYADKKYGKQSKELFQRYIKVAFIPVEIRDGLKSVLSS